MESDDAFEDDSAPAEFYRLSRNEGFGRFVSILITAICILVYFDTRVGDAIGTDAEADP